MNRLLPVLLLSATAMTGCSGGGMGKVKGKLVENGQPTTFPSTQASIQLSPIGPDGKPDLTKIYSAVVNPDGTFEVVASGGEVPTGMYLVAIEMTGKGGERYKQFSANSSAIRRAAWDTST